MAKGIMEIGELQEDQCAGMKRIKEDLKDEAEDLDGVWSSRDFKVHIKTYERVCDIVRILIWNK